MQDRLYIENIEREELTEEQEIELADKARAGCVESRNRLFNTVYYFIVSRSKGKDNLFQYMCLATLKVLKKFDRRQGKLTTFLGHHLKWTNNKLNRKKRIKCVEMKYEIPAKKEIYKEEIKIDLSILNNKERYIVLERQKGRRLKDLSNELGFTKQRVQQIESSSLEKLRFANRHLLE